MKTSRRRMPSSFGVKASNCCWVRAVTGRRGWVSCCDSRQRRINSNTGWQSGWCMASTIIATRTPTRVTLACSSSGRSAPVSSSYSNNAGASDDANLKVVIQQTLARYGYWNSSGTSSTKPVVGFTLGVGTLISITWRRRECQSDGDEG
jgi:hypothetical protein